MQPWQETVAKYDRKAHKKNAYITVSFIGGFRAIDDRRTGDRTVTYEVLPDETYEEVLGQVIDDLKSLMPKARELDQRIEIRQNQSPSERQYLYGDQ